MARRLTPQRMDLLKPTQGEIDAFRESPGYSEWMYYNTLSWTSCVLSHTNARYHVPLVDGKLINGKLEETESLEFDFDFEKADLSPTLEETNVHTSDILTYDVTYWRGRVESVWYKDQRFEDLQALERFLLSS